MGYWELNLVSDMTELKGYKLHPKAGRYMAAMMLASMLLTYFGKYNDWSEVLLYLSSLPAVFCVCVFTAQDIRIWKKLE